MACVVLRLLISLISGKLNSIASVYCFRHLDRRKYIGCQRLGSLYSRLYQRKISSHVVVSSAWMLVQILVKLVLSRILVAFAE